MLGSYGAWVVRMTSGRYPQQDLMAARPVKLCRHSLDAALVLCRSVLPRLVIVVQYVLCSEGLLTMLPFLPPTQILLQDLARYSPADVCGRPWLR